LQAILKYPKTEFEAEAAGETKFGIYNEDRDLAVYDWLFGDEPREQTLATKILNAADDIAYGVHDFEDGVWAGRIPLFRLVAERGTVPTNSWRPSSSTTSRNCFRPRRRLRLRSR